MKKIFLATCCALCLALGAKAQNFTVWYGANIANINFEGGSADSEFKPLNIGVSYTAPINDAFDWSAGIGYVSKGCKDWTPGIIQLEGSGAYNFLNNDSYKLGVFTGPTIGLMVVKDDAEGVNTFGFGWQGGLVANISCISLKAGYEYGFIDFAKEGKSKPSEIFFRVGYNF